MPRPRASVPPEAIRIEDEVWEEAFTRREPARRRLHAIDGGRPVPRPLPAAAPPEPARSAPRRSAPRATAAPRTATERRASEPSGRPVPSSSSTSASDSAEGGVPGRRTVTIRGQGAERNIPWSERSRRRPQPRLHERAGLNPDRIALWAVMLGILLVVVALASSHS